MLQGYSRDTNEYRTHSEYCGNGSRQPRDGRRAVTAMRDLLLAALPSRPVGLAVPARYAESPEGYSRVLGLGPFAGGSRCKAYRTIGNAA